MKKSPSQSIPPADPLIPMLVKVVGTGDLSPQMDIPLAVTLRRLVADRRLAVLCLAVGIFAGGGILLLWQHGTAAGFSGLKAGWLGTERFLQDHPWALFLALVILPGLPVPTSALLISAGVVWRAEPAMACLIALLALTVNLVWTYGLAAWPARSIVEKFFALAQVRIPQVPEADHLKWILILKLTPGIPLFLQNYLLGFVRAPFWKYLGISVLCNGTIGTGMVLSGAGMSNGRLMPTLTGLSLIAVAVIITRWIQGRRSQVAADDGA
jgi:uncharacterized membrane protein YdjX (TVP38/TMEM64 family)